MGLSLKQAVCFSLFCLTLTIHLTQAQSLIPPLTTASSCGADEVLVQRKCLKATTIKPHDFFNDDRVAIQYAIETAKTYPGPVIISLSPRTYNISCTTLDSDRHCLRIVESKNLKILGHHKKTSLIISSPLKGAFLFSNSQDVTLENLIIDYETAPFTQGEVLTVEANEMTFAVDPGYLNLNELLKLDGCTDSNLTCLYPIGEVHDRNGTSRARWISDYIATVREKESVTDLGNRKWKIKSYNNLREFVKVGDVVAFRPSTAHAIEGYHSTALSFHKIDVRAAPGAAYLLDDISSYIDMDTTNVFPKPNSNRVMSTGYDAYHIINSRGPLLLRNSEARNNGDDHLNISTIGWKVFAYNDSEIAIEPILKGAQSLNFQIGDLIQITNKWKSKLRLSGGGNTTVTEVRVDKVKAQIYLKLDASHAKKIQKGDILFNLSTSSPYSIVYNNVFGSHRGAIRMRSPGGTFYDNKFPDPFAATFLYSMDKKWDEGAYLEPPLVYGNEVTNGSLRIYGANWWAAGDY